MRGGSGSADGVSLMFAMLSELTPAKELLARSLCKPASVVVSGGIEEVSATGKVGCSEGADVLTEEAPSGGGRWGKFAFFLCLCIIGELGRQCCSGSGGMVSVAWREDGGSLCTSLSFPSSSVWTLESPSELILIRALALGGGESLQEAGRLGLGGSSFVVDSVLSPEIVLCVCGAVLGGGGSLLSLCIPLCKFVQDMDKAVLRGGGCRGGCFLACTVEDISYKLLAAMWFAV